MCSQKDARSTIEATRDHIAQQLGAVHLQSPELSSCGITSCCIDAHPENRISDEVPDQHSPENHDQRHWQQSFNGVSREELAEPLRDASAGLLEEQQGNALRNEHRRQRHNDWLQLEPNNEGTIDEPNAASNGDCKQTPKHFRSNAAVGLCHQQRVGKRYDRPGTEIEATADDYQGLPDSCQGQSRRSSRGAGQIRIAVAVGKV